MIRKSRKDSDERGKGRRRKPREPLNVHLTLKFNFGDEPEDAITVMNERRVPMVDSVFKSRDRIVRGFVSLLVRSGLRSPSVAREIFPVVRLLRRSGK